MNKNKKGGALSVKKNLNLDDIFHWVRNVDYIHTSSIGGYLFDIEIEKNNEFYSIFPGNNSDNMIRQTQRLLLKVVLIGNERINANIKKNRMKEIVTEEEFLHEVDIQKFIYEQSYDESYEPICAKILAHGFLDKNPNENDSAPYFFYDHVILNQFVKRLFRNRNTTKLGFFFMEYLGDNARPVGELFPNIKPRTPLTEGTRTEQQNAILKNYTYQLIKLAKLGIVHNDTHLNNALYYQDYDYIDNYKVILIDFGRSRYYESGVKDDCYNADKISNTFPNPKNNMVGFWSYLELNNYIKSIGSKNEVQRWFIKIKRNQIKASNQRFKAKLLENGNNEKLLQLVSDFNHTPARERNPLLSI